MTTVISAAISTELAEMLPAELEIDIEELQIALRHLQNMEPAGIGARSLAESLVLQLGRMPRIRRCARRPSTRPRTIWRSWPPRTTES